MTSIYIVYDSFSDSNENGILGILYTKLELSNFLKKWAIKNHPETDYDSTRAPSRNVYSIKYYRDNNGNVKSEERNIDDELDEAFCKWKKMKEGPAPGSYAALSKNSVV